MKTFINLAHRAFKKCASLGTINKKRYYLFIITMLLTLGVGNAWGETVEFDLTTKNQLTTQTTNSVVFTNEGATLTITKSSSGTAVNNYMPGGSTNASHTRVYKNNPITFDAGTGNKIQSITVKVTSSSGAINQITNGTWNPTVSGSGTSSPITYTLSSASQTASVIPAGTSRIEKVTLTYTAETGSNPTPTPDPDPENPNPDAGGETVTYVLKDDPNHPANGVDWLSGTIDQYTSWAATKGGTNNPKYYNTGEGLRVYNGGKFTITSTKVMTSITLTFSGTGYTFSAGNTTNPQTVTPNANSYEWSVSQTCRLQKIEITYAADAGGDEGGSGETVASLTANPTSLVFGNVTQNNEVEAKTFTISGSDFTTGELTITAPSGYTVNPTTVPVNGTLEETTITVTPNTSTVGPFNGNVTISGANLKSSVNVALSMTVEKAPATPTDNVYVKVTSTAGITNGEYLIVYEDATNTTPAPLAFNGALETLDASKNTVAVEISNSTIAGNTDIDAALFTIDVTAGTLKSASGKYIGVSSNTNGLKTEDVAKDYKNAFSIDDKGNAVIAADFEESTMSLRYNNTAGDNNLRFRYYKNAGQQPIALYKKANTVTIADCTNGSVSASVSGAKLETGAKVLSGTTITLGNTPATGHELAAYDVYKTGEESSKIIPTDGKFVMPEYNVTISATFQLKSYEVKATAKPSEGGTVTGADTYKHGESVTLTATANTGYEFVNWTKEGAEVSKDATYTFTASEDVTLVANFKLKTYTVTVTAENGTLDGLATDGKYEHGATVTLTATANTGYEFVNWTKEGAEVSKDATYTFTASEDVTLVANFKLKTYTVTVTAENGTLDGLATDGKYEHGATVTLTATANTGYEFVNWTKEGAEVSKDATYTFTASEDVTLVANFKLKTYTVTVTAENGTLDGLATDGKYEHGATVTLTATANTGYEFVNWTKEGAEVSKDATYTFTASEDVTLVANFQLNQYTITATATNGSVTGAGTYTHGAEVSLTADPAMDYTFVSWTKGGEVVSTANPFVFKATENLDLVANFTAISQTSKTLTGTFSVGQYEVAQFATGNLQYTNGTWGFAKQQYQYVGEANINIGDPTFTGTIDMFGWSTNETNYGVDPRNVNEFYDGEFVDWGDLFPVEDNWSTLSADQWKYLLNTRPNASSLKQIARVGSVVGIMLFPDVWNAPLTVTAQPDSYFEVDIHNYTLEQWAELEKAGALFLPAAGRRAGGYGNMINKDQVEETNPANLNGGHYKHQDNTNIYCYYWTSTINDSKDVSYLHNIQALGGDKYTIGTGAIWGEKGRYGQSVRLAKVTDITPETYTRTVTAGKLGTLCLPFGGTITGAVLYECVGSELGKVYLGSVTTLVAGVPYIFEATATELAVYSDGTTATAGSHNGLVGTFVDETVVAAGDYILLNNELRPSNGEAKVNANRAYLVMDDVPVGKPTQMPGRRYIGMSVQGENETTGFDNIQLPNANSQKLIINGQLIIIRNGEKFNAQGQKL